MAAIVSMIEETEKWRLSHKQSALTGNKERWIDAAYAACRQNALIDALVAIGGDDRKWRKPNGMFLR